MHRFFLPNAAIPIGEFQLPEEVSRQITRVLRLKPGGRIVLLDNLGFEYQADVLNTNAANCLVTILDKHSVEREPQTHISLIIGLTQREKFEFILQKCTEIGVSDFQPYLSSRTLIQKIKDAEEKHSRWEKILLEASEQCHRGKIPLLYPALPFDEAVSAQKQQSLKLLLWEEENQNQLKKALHDSREKHISLIIGPEGGLSTDEVETAKKAGYIPVSLGKRILRMETAAILAPAVTLYELEQ